MRIFYGADVRPNTSRIIFFLVATILVVYWQIGNHEFITYDDPIYVVENHNIRSGLTFQSITWAFSTMFFANWHPLTWLSYMLDMDLFGLNPAAYLLENMVFHAANACLLFFLLRRITGAYWRSAAVAALFALHPLHVESVAWVSERKDVLSTLFWLLTLLCYARYIEYRKPYYYTLALGVFVLGLLTKPMLVTLPFVLLLLDYWPLKRFESFVRQESSGLSMKAIKGLVLEKIPFMALAAASCIATIYAQKGAMTSFAVSPLSIRISNALVSYIQYLGKTFWPQALTIFYPFPDFFPLWQPAGAALLLVGITIAAVYERKRRPYLIIGWLWYILTLVPVIGIIRVGMQGMADRYTYIPLTGVFILLVWGYAEISVEWAYRRSISICLAVILLTTCSFVTWQQVSYWKSSTTLFNHALAVNRDNYIAHYNLGIVLEKGGNYEAALARFDKAIAVAQWYADLYIHRSACLNKLGRTNEALEALNNAIELNPELVTAHINRAILMAQQQRIPEAIKGFQMALSINPRSAEAHYNLGSAFHKLGRRDEAIIQYEMALAFNPLLTDCHNNLGIALAEQGRLDDAIRHFKEALRLSPNYIEAQNNLKQALQMK